jgi:hypothetical protein
MWFYSKEKKSDLNLRAKFCVGLRRMPVDVKGIV